MLCGLYPSLSNETDIEIVAFHLAMEVHNYVFTHWMFSPRLQFSFFVSSTPYEGCWKRSKTVLQTLYMYLFKHLKTCKKLCKNSIQPYVTIGCKRFVVGCDFWSHGLTWSNRRKLFRLNA